ncbi:MAG TPA: SPW repeat protein [Usitatibacter sp.]|nr:SPW repeat protein [Usitatibacter sp.]
MAKGCPWYDRLVLLLGIWLFFAPFALGVPSLSHPAVVSAYVCAVFLIGSAAQAPAIPDMIEESIALVAGASLAATPWLLDYTDEPALKWNAVAVGALASSCGVLGLVRRALLPHEAKKPAQIGSGS